MPLLAHRSAGKIINAALQKRHYVALGNMALHSQNFWNVFSRYLTGKGEYPHVFSVRTPTGLIKPTLYSYYDLLTLNEIFFRGDYLSKSMDRVVVDIGSNIGLSALYFLSRNTQSHCYLFEPDPRNVERLNKNLSEFKSRFTLSDSAVADKEGPVQFGLDFNSGRYGGLNADFGKFMTVNCVHINTVLKRILSENEVIDILKIDTEGTEISTIAAIDPVYLPKIRKIYIEAEPTTLLHEDFFHQNQYGTVCQLTSKSPGTQ